MELGFRIERSQLWEDLGRQDKDGKAPRNGLETLKGYHEGQGAQTDILSCRCSLYRMRAALINSEPA